MDIDQIIDKLARFRKIELIGDLNEKDLTEIIERASDAYYNNVPILSDSIFDLLVARLTAINPNAKILTQTRAVVTKGKKTKLPFYLGGMDKIRSNELKLLTRWLSKHKGPFVVSAKLDGMTGLLVYRSKTGKIELYSGGDGNNGVLISHLLKYANMSIDNLPKPKHDIAIRGEFIMTTKHFSKYSDTYANPRNLAGGLLNTKPESVDPDITIDLDFVTYELIEPTGMTSSEQLEQLKEWGLKVVKYIVVPDIDMEFLEETYRDFKEKSRYELDGLIVTDNNVYERPTQDNPKYSFAFKGDSITAITRLLDVIWEASKDGKLIPVAKYEPVKLSGVTLRSATAHNARFVKLNELKPGLDLLVTRSNEVIPYILAVIKKTPKAGSIPGGNSEGSLDPKPSTRQNSGNRAGSGNRRRVIDSDEENEEMTEDERFDSIDETQIAFPHDREYHWDKNNTHILLDDAEDDDTVKIKRITKFFANIGTEDMGEGRVTQLYNAGYDTIEDVLTISVKQMLKIEGFKQTLAKKIYNNIQTAVESLDIYKLMVASNLLGQGFGKRKIKKILDEYPTIADDYRKRDREEWYDKLIDIEGFAKLSVDEFLDNLPKFIKFYHSIGELVHVYPYTVVKKKSGKGEVENEEEGRFEGQTIVFTGFVGKPWQKIVEEQGGKMGSGVTGKTTLLVYKSGDESSTKFRKARELGKPMMTKEEFSEKYGLEMV